MFLFSIQDTTSCACRCLDGGVVGRMSAQRDSGPVCAACSSLQHHVPAVASAGTAREARRPMVGHCSEDPCGHGISVECCACAALVRLCVHQVVASKARALCQPWPTHSDRCAPMSCCVDLNQWRLCAAWKHPCSSLLGNIEAFAQDSLWQPF